MSELRVNLSAEQAVELYLLVANSIASNGLADLYVTLGALTEDEYGRVPSSLSYCGPKWRNDV